MADRFELRATPSAVRAITLLRGRVRDEYERFEPAPRSQGCTAAGYLLATGRAGYSGYCCKHLSDNWRLITRFEPGVVFIEAVGQHDDGVFYTSLSSLDMSAVGQKRDHKPGCCGDEGWPSLGSTRAQRRAAASH